MIIGGACQTVTEHLLGERWILRKVLRPDARKTMLFFPPLFYLKNKAFLFGFSFHSQLRTVHLLVQKKVHWVISSGQTELPIEPNPP